jgi:WD40 repeat protein
MTPRPPEHSTVKTEREPGWLPDNMTAGLMAEFRRRWEAHDRVRVEDFLSARNESTLGDALLLDLLYQEVILREQLGERPGVEEYVQRFPALAEPLRKQFALHQALAGNSLLPRSTEPGAASQESVASEPRTIPSAEGPPGVTVAGAPTSPHDVAIPGYRIDQELGRGGMGVVYKAWQFSLDRHVALKVILPSGADAFALRERFRREADAVARLQHPHIIAIHEVGEHEGAAFYCMEFCSGGTLAERLAATPQPPRWAAEVVATLARAMHHAHEKGVVHRDLKPANVLLTGDGTLKVSDFGLARRLGESGLTASWEILGTPSYMAPEQAWGHRAVGPAADVYALGAILYDCLTGRPPFKAATAVETIRQVADLEPVPPRRLLPALPRDLETICLKCLNKDSARRYVSAQALAEDLERFLAGRPILARPVGKLERAAKWVRRQPLAAVLIALVVLVALGAFAGLSLAWRRTETARKEALEEAEARRIAYEAEAVQRHRFAQQLYFSRIALADREIHANKIAWARHSLALCPEELRRWEWGFLRGKVAGQAPRTFQATDRGVGCLAFDRQGTTLAAACGDGAIRLWQVPDGKGLRTLRGHEGSVNWLCFSPDGQRLASGGADGAIVLWDVRSGEPKKRLLGHEQAVSTVAYHPNGLFLASATFDIDDPGEVWLWDVASGKEVGRFRGHQSRITALAYSADGRWLVSSGHDGTVQVLHGRDASPARTFRGHAFPVSAVAFGPNGLVASCAGRLVAEKPEEGEVLLWQAETGQVRYRLQGHSRRPVALAFSPDGLRLATAGWDRQIKLWEVASGQEVLTLEGHHDGVLALAFSPDGRRLASAGMGAEVILWEAAE